MNWLVIVWTMTATACLALALMHLLIWSKQRRDRAHLLFGSTALGAAGAGMVELQLLMATTVGQYHFWIRWQHVPLFILLISMVWSVHIYFGTGRRWLAQAITGLWTLCLLLNFVSTHNLVFREITGLKRMTMWGGSPYTIAHGVPNPWRFLADLGSVLIVIYVIDASLSLWRKGHNRRRAAIIGGSITVFIVAAGIHAPLVDAGWIQTPYMVSFAFLAIVTAMSFELGSDVVRASVLSQQVV